MGPMIYVWTDTWLASRTQEASDSVHWESSSALNWENQEKLYLLVAWGQVSCLPEDFSSLSQADMLLQQQVPYLKCHEMQKHGEKPAAPLGRKR